MSKKDKIITLLKKGGFDQQTIADITESDRSYVSKLQDELEKAGELPQKAAPTKPAEPSPPPEPEPTIDETQFTKHEFDLIHMMPKHGQQMLANKFLEDRAKRIELEKRAETVEKATPKTTKPPLPLSDEMAAKLADAATAVALAKQYGVPEEEMWNLIRQQQAKHLGLSRVGDGEADPLDYVMRTMAKHTAIKMMERLQKGGEPEGSKPLSREDIVRIVKETIEEAESRKREPSLTIEDVQKMFEAQAKEYEEVSVGRGHSFQAASILISS
jgi:hypothetical protein